MVTALVIRDFTIRFKTQFSTFLVFLEPISYIIIISLLFYAFQRKPSYGNSMVLFHSTGIFPFFLFVKILTRSKSVEVRRMRISRIFEFDLVTAIVIAELFVFIVPCIGVSAYLVHIGVKEAIPRHPDKCLLAVMSIVSFSAGIGLFLSALPELAHRLVSAISRGMLLVSGVFYVVDFLPRQLREWIVWNPVAQAITLFRVGVYEHYPAQSLNLTFLTIFSFGSVFFGLSLERSTRSWRRTWED